MRLCHLWNPKIHRQLSIHREVGRDTAPFGRGWMPSANFTRIQGQQSLRFSLSSENWISEWAFIPCTLCRVSRISERGSSENLILLASDGNWTRDLTLLGNLKNTRIRRLMLVFILVQFRLLASIAFGEKHSNQWLLVPWGSPSITELGTRRVTAAKLFFPNGFSLWTKWHKYLFSSPRGSFLWKALIPSFSANALSFVKKRGSYQGCALPLSYRGLITFFLRERSFFCKERGLLQRLYLIILACLFLKTKPNSKAST